MQGDEKHSCHFTLKKGRVYPQEIGVGELYAFAGPGIQVPYIGRVVSREIEGDMPTTRNAFIRKIPDGMDPMQALQLQTDIDEGRKERFR